MSRLDRRDITVDIIFKPTPKFNMGVEDIILEHEKLCKQSGAVWLGSCVKSSEKTIRLIDEKEHDIRFVFVAEKTGDYKAIYTADLIDIKIYKGEQKGYLNDNIPCPEYYKFEEKKGWFKLTNFKKLAEGEVNLDDYKLLFWSDKKVVSKSIKSRPCLLYAYKKN